MSLENKINTRIATHKATISGIGNENATEWHKKQIAILEAKIEELEWMLENVLNDNPEN
jgi:hypothetical protein